MNSIKKWEQEEKYKEFHKENFEKIDIFSKKLSKFGKIIFRICVIMDLIAIAGIFMYLADISIKVREMGGIF